jgi:hypothetical protein
MGNRGWAGGKKVHHLSSMGAAATGGLSRTVDVNRKDMDITSKKQRFFIMTPFVKNGLKSQVSKGHPVLFSVSHLPSIRICPGFLERA